MNLRQIENYSEFLNMLSAPEGYTREIGLDAYDRLTAEFSTDGIVILITFLMQRQPRRALYPYERLADCRISFDTDKGCMLFDFELHAEDNVESVMAKLDEFIRRAERIRRQVARSVPICIGGNRYDATPERIDEVRRLLRVGRVAQFFSVAAPVGHILSTRQLYNYSEPAPVELKELFDVPALFITPFSMTDT
jgi:hypothetical protein